MELQNLRAELERLFELEDLIRLSQEALGLDPEKVGGTGAKSSYVRALTDYCEAHQSTEALCDAVLNERPDQSEAIEKISLLGIKFSDDLAVGSKLGEYTLARKLGEGPNSICYVARKEGGEFRLKLLRGSASRDRRGLARFLTNTRLLARIQNDSLPQALTVASVDGVTFISQRYQEAQPLASRISRTGPLHLNEAKNLIPSILDALEALHEARLVHGNLKLENLLVYRSQNGDAQVQVMDAFADRLRTRSLPNGTADFLPLNSPNCLAPEVLRGQAPSSSSDIYALGALLYELFTGKAPFSASNGIEAAILHLTGSPEVPSSIAPRGWVSAELDEFILSLLSKSPDSRPSSISEVRDSFERLALRRTSGPAISEAELQSLVEAVKAKPADDEAALNLEAAGERGADPSVLGAVFGEIAGSVDASAEPGLFKSLGYRAARLFRLAGSYDDAENTYLAILNVDASDALAFSGLEEARRKLSKYEDIIDMHLHRVETAADGAERGLSMAHIGELYLNDLKDREQALVAFTQAFCENPSEDRYVQRVEALAGAGETAWNDVLSAASNASGEARSQEEQLALFIQVGKWYTSKLNRFDLALPCFQAALGFDPSNQIALDGLCNVYRKAQQWPELGNILMQRADASPSAEQARQLRAEAAEILVEQLGEARSARPILEGILAEDPGHEKASNTLARIYEQAGDHAALAKLFESQLRGLGGSSRAGALVRLGQLNERQLGDNNAALEFYSQALSADPANLDALQGQDRIFTLNNASEDLLGNLTAQLHVAATPRQKIALLTRLAKLEENEFMRASSALKHLEEAALLDARNPEVLAALTRLYRQGKEWEKLEQVLAKQAAAISEPQEKAKILASQAAVLADQLAAPARAIAILEQIVVLDGNDTASLDRLAQLRVQAGDAEEALSAFEALAASATTPEFAAEQWVRAGNLLLHRGDLGAAVERFQQARELNIASAAASAGLRTAYAQMGDAASAMQLVEKELELAQSPQHKARLSAELAKIAYEHLKDATHASEAAQRALDWDPSNRDALLVLSDISFKAERFLEAATYLERLVAQLDSIEASRKLGLVNQFVTALVAINNGEKAIKAVELLLSLDADSRDVQNIAADIQLSYGDAAKAAELAQHYVVRYKNDFNGDEQYRAVLRQAEAWSKAGELPRALRAFEEASDLDPVAAAPLLGLAKIYEDRQQWPKVVDVKTRLLDVVDGDERVDLLVELSEIVGTKLRDRNKATRHLVAALDERPDDRRILTRLMQLYQEDKDWSKLLDVISKLAEFVDDTTQKAQYLLAAGLVAARQLGDTNTAISFFEQVLALEPGQRKALDESIKLLRAAKDYDRVEEMLRSRLDVAEIDNDAATVLETLNELGELYRRDMGRPDDAIAIYERAQKLEPENRTRAEQLSALYSANPAAYMDRALSVQLDNLRADPYQATPYKEMRRIYTSVKNADGAWALCQALSVLKLADADEERFYKRMRSDAPAYAQSVLEAEDWLSHLTHHDADPLLTTIFSLIQPAVLASRGIGFEQAGYNPAGAINLAESESPMAQTLHYAAGVLGLDAPPTFANPNENGGLSFLPTREPSILMGAGVLASEIPPQTAAFIAARQLAFLRPGFYLRQLMPTGTSLKAWLFGAIKLIAPQFPIAAELGGPVEDALNALRTHLVPQAKDELASVVSKMLQAASPLDIKRWTAAVDLSADRMGLLLAHDLATAVEIIKATSDNGGPNAQARIKELVLFSVSANYLRLRENLQIDIQA